MYILIIVAVMKSSTISYYQWRVRSSTSAAVNSRHCPPHQLMQSTAPKTVKNERHG